MPESLREFIASQEFDKETEDKQIETAYQNSRLTGMLDKQIEHGEQPAALFTDIDNTFIRSGKEQASRELARLAEEKDIPIVAVTGNDLAGVMARIERGELPYFQIIAGSVGTEIWILHEDESGQKEYRPDKFYEKLLRDSGFIRTELVQNANQLIQTNQAEHPSRQLDFQLPQKEQELVDNPDPTYQPFKISFHFFAKPDEVEQMAEEASQKFPDQAVVTCEEIGYNQNLPAGTEIKKYCLDILPLTKAGAVEYLSKIAKIDKGIVAGDSGNDLNMLIESGQMNSVLVGGYKSEAKAGVDRVTIKKSGKRSFQNITTPAGQKAIYIEPNSQLMAAESILRAAKILTRAENIKKIKQSKE